MRRLGGARWTNLHRLIHVAAPLACIHYFWLVKTDLLPPFVYSAILAVLWLARLSLPGKDAVR